LQGPPEKAWQKLKDEPGLSVYENRMGRKIKSKMVEKMDQFKAFAKNIAAGNNQVLSGIKLAIQKSEMRSFIEAQFPKPSYVRQLRPVSVGAVKIGGRNFARYRYE
jgi:hypothetical protein